MHYANYSAYRNVLGALCYTPDLWEQRNGKFEPE